MSGGQLDLFGQLENWPETRLFLGLATTTKAEDGWSNDDWGWDEDNEKKCEVKDEVKSGSSGDTWPQNWVISHSSMGDVLVVANESRAVFFTSEWDVKHGRMKFTKSFQGEVSQEEGEKVTTAICIPLVSKKKTSPGAPDWTCIFLGFSSGYVRMYTETGNVLVSQQFHTGPVLAFKCRAYSPAHSSSEHDQLEEIFVLYDTIIATMDGFGLFQTLRACRNHLARLKANAADSVMDPPPLSYKRWQYESEEPVNDCESIGLSTPNTFEHLHTASVLGGYKAKFRQVPVTSYIYVSTGKKPYVAFHYAQEGQAVPILTEIAYAMASRLKSSLISAASGWLGFGGGSSSSKSSEKQQVKDKPQVEPPTPMSSRFGIVDGRRIGQCLTVSPCRKLTAVADMLGRVVLFDNSLGIAVRMWKGYRDAQLGWLQVKEDPSSSRSSSRRSEASSSSGRTATFLVIYAPKRGNLEVFAMQQGPKVATFPVSKNARLLGATFGMMGLNNIPIKGGNTPAVQCLFVDSDAKLFTVNVPFHLALCDKASSKVKDVHLLKTLQKHLKENENSINVPEILELVSQVKTQAMINQAFKILSHKCKTVETFRDVIEQYLQSYCDDDSKDLSVVFRIQALIDLYAFLVDVGNQPPVYEPKDGFEGESKEETILRCLHAADKEISVLTDMAQKNLRPTKGVRFDEDSKLLDLAGFLTSVGIEYDPNKVHKHRGLEPKYEFSARFGTLLFGGFLNNQSIADDWKAKVLNAGLAPRGLMQLALKYWCETAFKSSSYVMSMQQLYHVLTAVSELDPSSASAEFSRVNKWWESIRQDLTSSSQIFQIYSFALVCRGVAIDLQNKAELEVIKAGKKKLALPAAPKTEGSSEDEAAAGPSQQPTDNTSVNSSTFEMDEWENVSFDIIKWNLLLKQLEDLHLLSIILTEKPKLAQPSLPLLPNDIRDLSVLSLLDKGKGCIGELVGKWLTTIGINPRLLLVDEESPEVQPPPSPEPKKRRKKPSQSTEPSAVDEKEVLEQDEPGAEALDMEKTNAYVQDLLRRLKENFSVSLSSSIILANYCWEYCLEWNKDTNEVEYLTAAVKCISAIPSPHVKQGMMSMMWSTFIVKKFAVSAQSGKVGKEKFNVEKQSSFSSYEAEETFLRNVVHFLDNFMEVNVLCEGTTPPASSIAEQKKEGHWSEEMAASASLTDLAVVQPPSNYQMILLHYQVAVVTYCLHKFRIRKNSMKPMNLFDTNARMMLFQDMSAQAPFTNVEVDLALKLLREEFLCLVLSFAIHEIPEEMTEDEDDKGQFSAITPSLEGVQECETWVKKCYDLGRIWGLDLDILRINQVCEFYSSGFDLLGLEMISSVSAKDTLGSKLLVIAGMRVNFIIESNTSLEAEIMSSLSTNLTNWLKSLNYSKLRCLRFSKESISELAQQLIQLIPETSYDYKLAEELLHSSNFL